MPAPRWLARANRHITNPLLGPLALRLPLFGVIEHRGRRSGRLYRTPVNVFAMPGGYLLALTYGAESDWVKNVLAEGGCHLESRGRRHRLMAPRLVHDEGRRGVPAPVRLPLRLLRVSDFLLLSEAAYGDGRGS